MVRGSRRHDDVAQALQGGPQTRLGRAGIAVLEARLTHLAYRSGIAGAVGTVELVFATAREENREPQPPTRSDIVSNLVLVLTSDRVARPVLSTTTRSLKTPKNVKPTR